MLATIDSSKLDAVTGGADDGSEVADYAATGALANYCGSLDKLAKGMKAPASAAILKTQANDCWAGLRHSFTE